MENPRLLLLLLVAAGCITFPVSVFCSRRRVFENWSKVVSILLCVLGLGWTALAFFVSHLEESASGPTQVLFTYARTLLGGVCIGLIIALLIARPYRKVAIAKSQTFV